MPIKTGANDGLVRPIGTDRLDPLLTPSPRLDKGVGSLVVGVNVRKVLGMWVKHENGSSPSHSSSITGHVGRRRPYNTVPFVGCDVLDFSKHAFWRINFLDSDDLSLSTGYHINVVLKRASKVVAYNLERTGLRLNALGSQDINQVKMFPFEFIPDAHC